jgi:16S rRNA (guanine966-N2)-methyltransferase
MRVIAGDARGMRLAAPKGREIRPTVDRVRESIFNVISDRLEDARFLDIFAGTGANGIEALSRGAASAVFVDVGRASARLVADNLKRTRYSGSRGRFIHGKLPRDLPKLAAEIGSFSIIYADPPYDFEDYEGLLQKLLEFGLLASGGCILLEYSSRRSVDFPACGLCVVWTRAYGESTVAILERNTEGKEPHIVPDVEGIKIL